MIYFQYLCFPAKSCYFRHNVLPIVMGASPEEYTKLAPHHSFLHVDQFKGPRELAEYLIELDGDDEKYNEYFQVQ